MIWGWLNIVNPTYAKAEKGMELKENKSKHWKNHDASIGATEVGE